MFIEERRSPPLHDPSVARSARESLRGKGRGSVRPARARVEAASVFGQKPLVHASLQRCSADSVAFGLKARLSRLLNHEASVVGLRRLLARKATRVLRLGRSNRIKQALTEYRRLHAGLGHFKTAAARASAVDLGTFKKSLREVERSHRLASKVDA